MKKADVIIPGVYAVKVSGRIVPVRLEEPHAYGGWVGVNLKTGRAVRVRAAGKLRYQIPSKRAYTDTLPPPEKMSFGELK